MSCRNDPQPVTISHQTSSSKPAQNARIPFFSPVSPFLAVFTPYPTIYTRNRKQAPLRRFCPKTWYKIIPYPTNAQNTPKPPKIALFILLFFTPSQYTTQHKKRLKTALQAQKSLFDNIKKFFEKIKKSCNFLFVLVAVRCKVQREQHRTGEAPHQRQKAQAPSAGTGDTPSGYRRRRKVHSRTKRQRQTGTAGQRETAESRPAEKMTYFYNMPYRAGKRWNPPAEIVRSCVS